MTVAGNKMYDTILKQVPAPTSISVKSAGEKSYGIHLRICSETYKLMHTIKLPEQTVISFDMCQYRSVAFTAERSDSLTQFLKRYICRKLHQHIIRAPDSQSSATFQLLDDPGTVIKLITHKYPDMRIILTEHLSRNFQLPASFSRIVPRIADTIMRCCNNHTDTLLISLSNHLCHFFHITRTIVHTRQYMRVYIHQFPFKSSVHLNRLYPVFFFLLRFYFYLGGIPPESQL